MTVMFPSRTNSSISLGEGIEDTNKHLSQVQGKEVSRQFPKERMKGQVEN